MTGTLLVGRSRANELEVLVPASVCDASGHCEGRKTARYPNRSAARNGLWLRELRLLTPQPRPRDPRMEMRVVLPARAHRASLVPPDIQVAQAQNELRRLRRGRVSGKRITNFGQLRSALCPNVVRVRACSSKRVAGFRSVPRQLSCCLRRLGLLALRNLPRYRSSGRRRSWLRRGRGRVPLALHRFAASA